MPSTASIVHNFVRAAVLELADLFNREEPVWRVDRRWERGPDGAFRPCEARTRESFTLRHRGDLRSIHGYEACVEALKSDKLVGPHLDNLVGTSLSSSRLEVDTILWSLIYKMINEEGRLAFDEALFRNNCKELSSFFIANTIGYKTVIPLPNIVIPNPPFSLDAGIVLDVLSDEEVSRCVEVGILGPSSHRSPIMGAEVGVGIRATQRLQKRIGDTDTNITDFKDPGSFGARPSLYSHLLVDDILSSLRLLKHSNIRPAGEASWHQSWLLGAGTSFRCLRRWPYGGTYELSETEAPILSSIWRQLKKNAATFEFSIRRFNLSFDRDLLEDRVVDLVIAAESLFLGELDVRDRGELRYRFALRSAKFIGHPTYTEREVFQVMRRAYDARSSVVHGGSPKDTRLPSDDSADFPQFTDVVEELVRLGLRKALSLAEAGQTIRKAEYWDNLVFGRERGDISAA